MCAMESPHRNPKSATAASNSATPLRELCDTSDTRLASMSDPSPICRVTAVAGEGQFNAILGGCSDSVCVYTLILS